MYEHLLHKKSGFQVAKNKTAILSKAAFHGECDKLNISKTKEYLTLIPFYGGLPPNVSDDFSKVRSIGQGNSLVDPSIKVLQCMATVCSCLKYFGHVVIGVVRTEDRELITAMVTKQFDLTYSNTHYISFSSLFINYLFVVVLFTVEYDGSSNKTSHTSSSTKHRKACSLAFSLTGVGANVREEAQLPYIFVLRK